MAEFAQTSGLALLVVILAALYCWATFSWWGWWMPFIIWWLAAADTENWALVWVPFLPWVAVAVLAVLWWVVLKVWGKPMSWHPLWDSL